MKTLKIILLVIFGIILLLLILFGYWGFVPGLSPVMGSTQPRDLGVTYTDKDYEEAMKKQGVAIEYAGPKADFYTSVTHEGKKTVKESFTGAEITAMTSKRNFGTLPFSNIQVKINQDGSFEMSGMLDIDSAVTFAQKLGASKAEIDKGIQEAKLPFTNMPFYLKGTGGVKNGTVFGDFTTIEVGRFPIPATIITQYTPALREASEWALKTEYGVTMREISFKDGKVYVDGDYPAKEVVK